MSEERKVIEEKRKIVFIGLGYVGLPMAIEFSDAGMFVIGYDISEERIDCYKKGIDILGDIGSERLKSSKVKFTSDKREIQNADVYIIAVPTPISQDKNPDLEPVVSASQIVGRSLKKKSYVIYESTVYPGVTEGVCIPILEEESGLRAGKDFKVGYSPERVNPGDKMNTIKNIVKIVSGMDDEATDVIADIYGRVITAGVFKVSNIKTAEAIKVAENSQRDVNIAFMNELALVFDRIGINTNEVLQGMNTKWNALNFCPGLVGGHCIGVDPYYFIYEAEKVGYQSQIIAASRRINDMMGEFIADTAVRLLIQEGVVVKGISVLILGFTFKENCSDIRNTKVIDIINRLKFYGVQVHVVDPIANIDDVKKEYGITISNNLSDISNISCIILAVAHKDFRGFNLDELSKKFSGESRILLDVKSIFNHNECDQLGITYWNL